MRRPVALLAVALLALAGCGGSGGSGGTASSASATPLPGVSGSYGEKPTLTFPTGKPPGKLRSKVLRQGSGAVVAKGDLLVADYLGQVWKGKVFDNSYDRNQPAAFPIGVGQVIPGWDKTLVGVKAGSRVELSVPPAQGYGSSGNSKAGIKGTDTLVFVVDVVGSYGKSATGDPKAARRPAPAGGPQVSGALSSRPKVTVPKGAKAPAKTTAVVISRGSGPPVKEGLLVVQYEAVDYTGKAVGSTWTNGTPAGAAVGASGQNSPFDALRGIPVGSRVLLEVPAQQGQPALAVAVDLVAQPGTAKQAA